MKTKEEMIMRCFTKCGMTTAVDCSEDNRLIIDGIKYVMLQREGEFYLETSCEEEEERKVSAS